MTDPQRITMMADWWPAACRAQEWKISDRALRMRVLSVAVSFPKGHFRTILDALAEINSPEPLRRELNSANDLDSRDDVDRVKALLLFLAGDLKAAQEIDNNEGKARRSRFVVVNERLRCLALYPLEQPMGMAGAQGILAELLRDFFNKGRRHEVVTLEDISEEPRFYRKKGSSDLQEGPSQLQRLLMRLDGLLHTNKKGKDGRPGVQGYRVKAGHSLHDMKIAAGLECNCALCCSWRRANAAAAATPIVPPLAKVEAETVENPDWNV